MNPTTEPNAPSAHTKITYIQIHHPTLGGHAGIASDSSAVSFYGEAKEPLAVHERIKPRADSGLDTISEEKP